MRVACALLTDWLTGLMAVLCFTALCRAMCLACAAFRWRWEVTTQLDLFCSGRSIKLFFDRRAPFLLLLENFVDATTNYLLIFCSVVSSKIRNKKK